jgi:hypothetical protein
MLKPLILAAALSAALVAALATPAAQASPAALQKATSHCWLDVINDWLDNNRVDKTYAIPCYTQAIQQLNARPDVAGYSSAVDDIHRALLAAIHQERGDGGPPSSGGASPGAGPGGGPSSNPPSSGNPSGGTNPTGGGDTHHSSFLSFGSGSSATSIPLPLIILGALAILLALAALATWFARRLQARRPAPQPAIAKRR